MFPIALRVSYAEQVVELCPVSARDHLGPHLFELSLGPLYEVALLYPRE